MRKLRRPIIGLLVVLTGAFLVSCQGEKVQAANDTQQRTFWQQLTHAPKKIKIPVGTRLEVRLSNGLSSQKSRSGDKFAAVLAEPLVAEQKVVVPKGVMVSGEVVEARPSGHLKTPAELGLTLTSIETGGKNYDLSTSDYVRYARSHKKHDAKWIGGAAAGGALLGALVGGGKGAAIGAGVGAGGGTAGAYATGRKDIYLAPEARISFTLTRSLVVEEPH